MQRQPPVRRVRRRTTGRVSIAWTDGVDLMRTYR